jgi:predicted SAM-dependent methyltransferase
MSIAALITELRQKALETLQESSEMFEKSLLLLKDGKLEQAKEMQERARQKRSDSTYLMVEANRLDEEQPPSHSSRSLQR